VITDLTVKFVIEVTSLRKDYKVDSEWLFVFMNTNVTGDVNVTRGNRDSRINLDLNIDLENYISRWNSRI